MLLVIENQNPTHCKVANCPLPQECVKTLKTNVGIFSPQNGTELALSSLQQYRNYCAETEDLEMSLNQLPGSIFDLVLIVTLLMGLFRGRKHGMSAEMMHLIKWLVVVVVCGFLYQPLGEYLARSSPFSLLASFIMVYAVLAMLILGFFAFMKHHLGEKLVGSDIFGRSEYYLGMGSGLVRFGCVLLAGLALLNARYFSPAEVQAMERFQNDVYGSNFFPTWYTAQEVVFERSISGPWIRDHLAFLLIHPTEPEDKSYHQKEASLP
jgi:uncharacterized membrane protein required for colicin V production